MDRFPRRRLPLQPCTFNYAPLSPAENFFGITELLEHILTYLPAQDIFKGQRVNRTTYNTIAGSTKLLQQMFLVPTACLAQRPENTTLAFNPLLTFRENSTRTLDLAATLNLTRPDSSGLGLDFTYLCHRPEPTLYIGPLTRHALLDFGSHFPPAILDMTFTQPVVQTRLVLQWAFDSSKYSPSPDCRITATVKPSSPSVWFTVIRALAEYAPIVESDMPRRRRRRFRMVTIKQSKEEYREEVEAVLCGDPEYRYRFHIQRVDEEEKGTCHMS